MGTSLAPISHSDILKPVKVAGKAIKSAVVAIDKYTSPRESTGGDFDKPSYFQGCAQSAVEGFYLRGLTGVAAGVISSAAGVFAEQKTGSMKVGILAGGTVGATLQVGIGLLAGAGPQALVAGAVTGGLMGVFFTIRGNPSSKTRDSAGNANMITAVMIHGPSKLAGGIGAAVGSKMESRVGKAVVGALTAAAIGGALAAIGFSPVGIVTATLLSGAAGAAGPFVGPRFSQFFRNLSNDLGNLTYKFYNRLRGRENAGVPNEKAQRVTNVIGAVPSSFIKEGMRGFALSDGGFSGFALGGIMEAIQQAQIFLCSKIDKNKDKEEEKAGEGRKVA